MILLSGFEFSANGEIMKLRRWGMVDGFGWETVYHSYRSCLVDLNMVKVGTRWRGCTRRSSTIGLLEPRPWFPKCSNQEDGA